MAECEGTAATSFRTVAARLPLLVVTSPRLAAGVSRRRTVALLLIQVVSSVAGAFGLYAITGVLAPLFADGTTPDRVRAALPSLVAVAALTAARVVCDALSKALADQLDPTMDARAQIRLQDLCTRSELVAFDKAD